MFQAVPMEREFGGGGSLIARRVAEILGWNLLDRELIDAVARATHVDAATVARYDERVDSWWRRLHLGGVRAAAIQAGMPIADAEFFDFETVAGAAQRVIAMAAAAGNCVIVGRGGQCLLQGRADVLHVFIYGPWRERVTRVRSRVKQAHNVAELIQSSDRERAGYIRTHHGCDWKDPHLYQMMISSRIGVENAAFLIVEAVLGAGEA